MERKFARTELKKRNTIKRIILACSVVVIVVLAGIGTTKLTYRLDKGSTQVSQNIYVDKKKARNKGTVAGYGWRQSASHAACF